MNQKQNELHRELLEDWAQRQISSLAQIIAELRPELAKSDPREIGRIAKAMVRMICDACRGTGWIIGTVSTHRDLCPWCLGVGTAWGLPR